MAAKKKRKRRHIIVVDKGLRYLLMAATGDFPQLRGRTTNQALVWLGKYAMAILYLDRPSLGYYLAQKLYDERYPWAKEDDPMVAMAEAALIEPSLIESVILGKTEPSNEFLSAIAGALNEDVETLLEMVAATDLGEQVDVRAVVD